MTDIDVADDWLDDGRSGRLTVEAREAATAAALPLLASYFATGADTPDHSTPGSGQMISLHLLSSSRSVSCSQRLNIEPMLRAVLDRPVSHDRVKDSRSVSSAVGSTPSPYAADTKSPPSTFLSSTSCARLSEKRHGDVGCTAVAAAWSGFPPPSADAPGGGVSDR